MSNGPHRMTSASRLLASTAIDGAVEARNVTLIDEQGRVSMVSDREARALETGGPQTQHMPARGGPGPRVQGMVFDTSTPEGKAALEQYRRTGKAPKHPGVAALEAQAATQAALPFPGMEVIYGPAIDPERPLFTPEDAQQALAIFDVGTGNGDRHAAILHVMLFALRVAAVNLDVHPE